MKRIFTHTSLILLMIIYTCSGYGEGTREVMPTNTTGTGLIVSTTTSFPLGKVGNYFGCPFDNRIYFDIKDFTKERLYYGFHWNFLTMSGSTTPYTDVYMRIYNPVGTLVATINLPSSGNGFINSYLQAVNGPNIGGATPAGYAPRTYLPTQNGKYWIELYRSNNGGLTSLLAGESMLSPFFDLTVAETNNTQYKGRVHCNKWAFSVYDPATYQQSVSLSSQAQFFAYTTDSVTVKVDFQTGFKPLAFIIAVNNYGIVNSGNWINDRKSINSSSLPALAGGYNVFLNQPDPTLYPVGSIPEPPSLVSPVIAGCPPGPYTVRFNAPQDGDYYILLDLNGIPGFQDNSRDRFFELIDQKEGLIIIMWDGNDGLGTPVPVNTAFPITFSFRKGRINVPLYDVEMNINGFSVAGIAPMLMPASRLYWDDRLVYQVGGGMCSSSTTNNNTTTTGYANDIVGQPSPGHAWNGNGNPGYNLPAPGVGGNDVDLVQCNDFGNARLINTWAWGIELYITQNLTLGCINVSGTVWDDADNSAAGTFSNIRTNSEPGTNAGNQLYAILVDPVTNNAIATTTVNADGTYYLSGCPIDAIGMKVVISTTNGVIGSPVPVESIPADWVRTSPLTHTFNSGVTNVTGIDFGIEKIPNSDPQYYTIVRPLLNSFLTLNGAGTLDSPGLLKGSDFEDGFMGGGKTVNITNVPVNAELYYNGILVVNNTIITNYNPALLRIKFTNVAILSTTFYYAYIDVAGKQDPSPAPYEINFSGILTTIFYDFNLKKSSNNSTLLNWSAFSDSDNGHYVIERSLDGIKFTPIGNVDAIRSASVVSYKFTDYNLPEVTNCFYRIALISNGTKNDYSNTLKLTIPAKSGLEIYPNPFIDRLTVKLALANAETVTIILSDNTGRVIQRRSYTGKKGQNTFELDDLSSLPPSVYFMQVMLPGKFFIQKAFKQ